MNMNFRSSSLSGWGCVGILLATILVLAINFGFWAAVTAWGIIPLSDAIWDTELPFWPTYLVVLAVTGLLSMIFGAARK